MKENTEAYQSGELDGWDDGYYDRQRKEVFQFPSHYSELEKQNYLLGYEEGYKQGSRDC